MKILFLSPNRQSSPHRVMPVGILYLASGLITKGYSVRVVDLMFSADPASDIISAIHDFNPDVTCISIRNINQTMASRVEIIPDIDLTVATVKQHSDSRIVLGGAGFSLVADELMERFHPLLGIIGEADHSLPELIECLEKKQDYRHIPGLVYSQDGRRFISNPTDTITDLDDIPFQAIEMIDYVQYAKKAGNLGVFTRKSCPQRCIYCAESQINGSHMRLRSADKVADEIEYLIEKTGMTDFDFSDTLFNVPRKHAVDVCREIIRRKIKIRFEVELNPIGQDAESVELLKSAGCRAITLTADSGSDRILQTLQKGYRAEEVLAIADLYAEFKIPYLVCFLLGGPGENLESIEETLTCAAQCSRMTAALFAFGIRVFKSTPLHKMMIEQNLIDENSAFLNPRIYLSPSFDDQCAERILTACRQRQNFFISEHAFCFNSKILQFLANHSTVRPSWKYIAFWGLLLRLKNLGGSSLTWDRNARIFRCGKSARDTQ